MVVEQLISHAERSSHASIVGGGHDCEGAATPRPVHLIIVLCIVVVVYDDWIVGRNDQ